MKKNKKFKSRSRDDNKNSPFEDRKKFCPFSQKNSPIIDYKDVKLLNRYISEKGKITPSRITNVSREAGDFEKDKAKKAQQEYGDKFGLTTFDSRKTDKTCYNDLKEKDKDNIFPYPIYT